MRVLLVQPRRMDRIAFRGLSVVEPLGLEIVAGCLEGHDVRIADFLPENRIDKPLREFQPDVVGISCSFTMDVYQALDIARQAKEADKKPFVVVGGHHPTLNPHDFATGCVDAIVLGEGEITFPELVLCLQQGGRLENVAGMVLNDSGRQMTTGMRPLISDLNSSPPPRRNLTGANRQNYFMVFEKPVALVETARGCPYRCSFCSVWRFYRGTCRYKTPERVIEELAQVKEPIVFFTDDNFLLNVNRSAEIARLVKQAGIRKRYFFQARSDTIVKHPEIIKAWKEIGLGGVFIGMEKTDEQELASIHKGNTVENNTKAALFLQSLNLGVMASFIVDPGYTESDFQKLRDYLARWDIRTPSFTVLTPLPGTELFDEVKDKLQTADYELFDLIHAVLPTELELPEFYRQFASLYSSTFSAPKLLAQGIVPFLQEIVLGRKSRKHFFFVAQASAALKDPAAYLSSHDGHQPAEQA